MGVRFLRHSVIWIGWLTTWYVRCIRLIRRTFMHVTWCYSIVDDYCYPFVSSNSPRTGKCLLPRSHYLLQAAKRCPFPGSPVRVYRAAPPYTVTPTVSYSFIHSFIHRILLYQRKKSNSLYSPQNYTAAHNFSENHNRIIEKRRPNWNSLKFVVFYVFRKQK